MNKFKRERDLYLTQECLHCTIFHTVNRVRRKRWPAALRFSEGPPEIKSKGSAGHPEISRNKLQAVFCKFLCLCFPTSILCTVRCLMDTCSSTHISTLTGHLPYHLLLVLLLTSPVQYTLKRVSGCTMPRHTPLISVHVKSQEQ